MPVGPLHKPTKYEQVSNGTLIVCACTSFKSLAIALVGHTGANKAGVVTSVAQLPDGSHIGLGYVKCRTKGVQVAVEGLHLSAEGVSVEVRSFPNTSKAAT